MVEKITSKFITALPFDRGGEYVSTNFMNVCEEQGIRRFLTALYSPQPNGVAEKKNRIILDLVRSMLKSKHIPKDFWAEAVQCAIYVQNRCPHAKLENKTPQEAWSGRKPIVAHFKVFRSVAYGQIPDQRRTKLDDRRKKFVFIRYDEKIKGYKLMDPINKKVVVNRDVIVDEACEWDWEKSVEPTVVEQGKTTSIVELTNNGTNTSNDLPISDDEAEPRNQRTHTLKELYDSTGEVHLVCLMADIEDISFEEALIIKKWQTAIEEEIKAIE
ncbi:retrovirus-related pol polyprotein from transposon TNT 1-94 [Tanacetum coccineum]